MKAKKYPEALLIKIFKTYDVEMSRFDHRLSLIEQHKNEKAIERSVSTDMVDDSYMNQLYEPLTNREISIIKSRYLKSMTLSQCHDEYHVSMERIRQIEVRAIGKMKAHASENTDLLLFWS